MGVPALASQAVVDRWQGHGMSGGKLVIIQPVTPRRGRSTPRRTTFWPVPRSAIVHGHKVRNRFTLGDVLELLGLLTPTLADQWLAGQDFWGGFCPPA